MTIPIGRYATLGPAIPPDGLPDTPPLRILHIQEIAERNALNEIIFIVDAFSTNEKLMHAIKVLVAVNPFNGEPTRAAVLLRPGTGFVAIQPECLPGNLVDICRTIALDPRETT